MKGPPIFLVASVILWGFHFSRITKAQDCSDSSGERGFCTNDYGSCYQLNKIIEPDASGSCQDVSRSSFITKANIREINVVSTIQTAPVQTPPSQTALHLHFQIHHHHHLQILHRTFVRSSTVTTVAHSETTAGS
jgi:hypothetical protein